MAKYTKIAEDCRTTRETLALAELAADLIPAGKGRENAKKAIALGTFTCDLVEKVSAFNLIDGVGALSSLTDIGGSAKRLFQVLAGGGNDGIKAEIQAMREDLQKTREQMHQRFDRIEIQIDELHDAIDDGFNAVLSDTKDIKTTLSNVIDRLERIEYKTDQISAALSKISELNIQMSDREIQESVFPTIDITPVEIGDISKAISFYINLGSSVATSPALFPKTADTAVGNSSSTPISIADLRNEIRPAVDGPLPGVTQIGYNASLNDVIFKLADVLGKDPLVSNNKGVIELVKFRDDLKFGNKRVPNELLWRYSVDQLERVLLNHPNAITQIIASDSVSKDPQPLIDAGQTIIRAHTLLRSTELLAALYQVYERESTNLCDSMLDWERSWKQKKHIRDFNLWQSDSPPSAYDGLADEFSGSFELKHINRTAVLAVPGDLTAKLPMEIRSWVKHGYGSIRGRWEVDFAQTARQVDIDTERGNKKSTEYDATFYLTLILSFEPKLPDGSGLTPVEFMRSQLAVEKSNWRYDSNKYYTFNYFWDQWENPKRANFKETFTARASHTVNQGNITAIRTSLAPWADAVRQSYNADIAKAISSDDKSLSEEGALGESILRIRGISRAIDAAVRLGYPDGENDDTIAACLNGKNRIPDQGIFAEFGSRYSSWQSTDPSLVNSPLYIFFAQQSRSAFGYSDGWCLPGAAINSTFCRSLPGADELEEISQYAELPISAANVIESRERNEALRQGLRLDLPVRQVVTLEGGVAFMLPKSNQSTGLTQHLLALKIVNGMESPIPLVEEGLQVLRGIKTVVMKK